MKFGFWHLDLIKVGIECESIEGEQSWGVGRIVKKLLEEIANRPELAKEFRFFLYFKSQIPNYPWLTNPIFVKKAVLKHSHILKNVRMNSFSLYYYILLPVKLWFERLDVMFLPNYMLPIIFRGKSLVMLTEDIYYEINSGTLPWRYKLAYKIFAGWWAARHATKIMAISETSKRELTKLFGIASERIVVNQLGVDGPNQNHKSQINSKSKILKNSEIQNSKPITYNLKPNAYFLYVGQAFPRRRLRETMLAFELLVPPNSKFHIPHSSPRPPRLAVFGEAGSSESGAGRFQLIAIGKDKYNPPIIEKLKNEINGRMGRNAIIYKEYVSEDELAGLYANAKCVVYVSSREAFGLPPLEALAYGTLPVVADQPITREIFGDNAFFVENPDDPQSIAKAIKKALTNEAKRQEIIANASRILEKYTWQKHADRFLRIACDYNPKI